MSILRPVVSYDPMLSCNNVRTHLEAHRELNIHQDAMCRPDVYMLLKAL